MALGLAQRGKALGARQLALLFGLLVFGASFGVYVGTLSPSITWRHFGSDSGDLVTAAYVLGVPHPTGYPTFMLLGKAFTFLPFGEVAFRVNLMSAFFGAAAVGLVYGTALRLLSMLFQERRPFLAIASASVGALLFAFSPMFWSQAIIGEVYALHAFFVAAVLFLLVWWCGHDRSPGAGPAAGPWPLYLAGFLFGLGMGNHVTLAFLLPTIAIMVLPRLRSLALRDLVLGLLAVLLGLGVYLYLPIRAMADPPVNWGDPSTLPNFYWSVSAPIYRDFVFGLPASSVPDRLVDWLLFLVKPGVFPGTAYDAWVAGLVLAGLGAARLWSRPDKAVALSFLALFVVSSAYAIGYNTADSFVYLIPVTMVMALLAAVGLAGLFGTLEAVAARTSVRLPPVPLAVAGLALAIALPAVTAGVHFRDLDQRQDRAAREYGVTALASLEPGALLLGTGDPHVFSLWYAQHVLRVRGDVPVVVVPLLQFQWYVRDVRRRYPDVDVPDFRGEFYSELNELVRRNIGSRPMYLTDAVEGIRFGQQQSGLLLRLADQDST